MTAAKDQELPTFVKASLAEASDGGVKVCAHLSAMLKGGLAPASAEAYVFAGLLHCRSCLDHAVVMAAQSGLPYECGVCGSMEDGDAPAMPMGGWRLGDSMTAVILRLCAGCAPAGWREQLGAGSPGAGSRYLA